MSSKLVLALSMVALMAFSYGAFAQATVTESEILVYGDAVMNVAPDLSVINVEIETRADTVNQAQENNARHVKIVLDTLSNMGISEEAVETRYFNVRPIEVYHYSGREEIERVGFSVSHSLAISVDVDRLNEVLDAILKTGSVTRISYIEYDVSEKKRYQSELLAMALDDAKAKAQGIARTSGLVLDVILSVHEEGGTYMPYVNTRSAEFAMAAYADVSTSVTPADQTLTTRLKVTFRAYAQR